MLDTNRTLYILCQFMFMC